MPPFLTNPYRFGNSIRAIQTVLYTQAIGDDDSTISFGNLTNADKCIPFISGKANAFAYGTDSDIEEIFWSIDIYNSGGVKADVARNPAATGNISQDLALTLLEFPSTVTVAKYTFNSQVIAAGDYIDCTITAVDTSKSFIVCTAQREYSAGLAIHGQTGGVCATFTSSTNVRVYCVNDTETVPKIILYVVTDTSGSAFTVTSTTGSLAGSVRSTNITVPSHDQSKTLAIVNWHASSGSGSYPNIMFVDKHTWTCYPSSNTNFVMACHNTNTGPFTAQYNVQLITFTSGVTIQRGRMQPATNVDTVNATITSVDLTKSAVVTYLSGHLDNGAVQHNNSGCDMGEAAWKLRLSSATNVEATRHGSGSIDDSCDFGWQVITTS